MNLTFDLEGRISHLHPNQVDNEQAVHSSLCECVCVHFDAGCNVCGCAYTEKLDLAPQCQKGPCLLPTPNKRTILIRRGWGSSLVSLANAHHFLTSFLFRVNISLTAIISTAITTATASGTRVDLSPQPASLGSDRQ